MVSAYSKLHAAAEGQIARPFARYAVCHWHTGRRDPKALGRLEARCFGKPSRYRQLEREDAAFAGQVLHANHALVRVGGLLGNRQAKPEAAAIGAELRKWRERLLDHAG